MLRCQNIHPFSRYAVQAGRLYLTAFPPVERHRLSTLHWACVRGKAEWLVFSDGGTFVGMAYMIVRGDVAFLLYLAVADAQRDKGYGGAILAALSKRYPTCDLVLLIESLHEECDNRDVRIRRRAFYLRNGMIDTGILQQTFSGEANYDILNSRPIFDRAAYTAMLAAYPFRSYLLPIETDSDGL